jgi:EmrB/QacA subfamily drug resistance transporter
VRETNRGLATVGVLLGTALAALDGTIVGTAMPTIIGRLGGMALYSWVFSGYLLTSTTTVPIYGRLADLYGRKPLFLIGSTLFLIGSMLCGMAHSMWQLILFRAVQGLGAGSILTVTITIIGDLYTLEQRARMQGLFAGVWGIASIIGPITGGYITDHFSWRWIFYINVPVGLASGLLLAAYLHERVERRPHALDWWGTAALSLGVAALLLALLKTGEGAVGFAAARPFYGWAMTYYAAAAVLLGLFWARQVRAAEPLLPLSLFQIPLVGLSCLTGFLVGATMFGIMSYLPLYAQGVLNGSALDAGRVLMPMAMIWPIGSAIAGRLILRLGYRASVTLGTTLVLVGTVLLLVTLTPSSPQWHFIPPMAILGLGMGFSVTGFVIAVQNAVGWGQRGLATATAQFCRSIGGAVGVALLGAVLNSRVRTTLAHLGVDAVSLRGASHSPANALLNPEARATMPPETFHALQLGLAGALHAVFWIAAVTAALALVTAWFFPGGTAEMHRSPDAAPAHAE